MPRPMRKQLIQSVVLLLISVSAAGPVFELFDHWDQFLRGGSDFVLTGLGLCICFGLMMLLGRCLTCLFHQFSRLLDWLQPSPSSQVIYDSRETGSAIQLLLLLLPFALRI